LINEAANNLKVLLDQSLVIGAEDLGLDAALKADMHKVDVS
jgi:beta-phosphoglucomutase-like phosphatase (HAD superfamily)